MLPYCALLIGFSWLTIVAWLLLRAVRQFREFKAIEPRADFRSGAQPYLSVIVPARNEAANIAFCLRSLTAQDYPHDFLDITVVDDDSTDDTAAIVREIGREDSRVRLISAGELAPGWTGKSHACWKGAERAQGEWLCFIDADTTAAPALLATAVSHARTEQIDMLSLEPRQVLRSFWERLTIPAGLVLLSFIVDLRSINDAAVEGTTADGQFILLRRDVYRELGGHYAVRGEIYEDSALANLAQQAGYKTFLMGAGDLIRVRMYPDFNSLWDGLARNVVGVMKNNRNAIFAALGALFLGWAALFLPVWIGSNLIAEWNSTAWGFTAALLGSFALLAINIGQTIYFQIPLWYGLVFPLGYTVVAASALRGVWRKAAAGLNWKGRTYSGGSKA